MNIKPIAYSLLVFSLIALSSCAYATKDKVVMFGGKGAYKSQEYSLVYNGEKSFRDGAIAVTTVAAAAYSAASQAAAETTAQVTSNNAAKVTNAKTAADSAVAIQQNKGATAVAIEGIHAAAPAAP